MKSFFEVLRDVKQSGQRRALILLSLVSLTAMLIGIVNVRAHAASPTKPTIVVLGDSISAEYGIDRGSGWAALMQKRLASQGFAHRVVNASISGETTAGGRTRIKRLLSKHEPAVLILELGGNDALRGLDLANTRANLAHIGKLTRQAGAGLLVLGMQVPPNYGQAYTEKFAGMFTDLAKETNAGLVPFFLSEIATDDKAFQPDGIHPTQAVQGVLLETMWDELVPLLKHQN